MQGLLARKTKPVQVPWVALWQRMESWWDDPHFVRIWVKQEGNGPTDEHPSQQDRGVKGV